MFWLLMTSSGPSTVRVQRVDSHLSILSKGCMHPSSKGWLSVSVTPSQEKVWFKVQNCKIDADYMHPMNEGSQLDLPSGPFPRPFHITMALFQLHQSIKMKRCRSICVDSGFFSKKIFLHVNGTYRLKNSLFLVLYKSSKKGLYLVLKYYDQWPIMCSLSCAVTQMKSCWIKIYKNACQWFFS